MNNYSEFFEKFGASCRTKHIVPFKRNPYDFREIARCLLRRGHYSAGFRYENKRLFNLPGTSLLPREYIRLDPWEMEYLFMLASTSKKGIVETGRFHGGSTFVLAYANRSIPINSIDIAPQNDAMLQRYFELHGIGSNAELIIGDSQNTQYPQIGKFDLLFIDGDHSYEGCTKDLENWYPALVKGGHIVLHDCYFGENSSVQAAVTDFIDRHDVEVVQSPYIPENHWHFPCGSLAHLRKIA